MGSKAKAVGRRYEVIEWQGNTWIRRVGSQYPLAYLEGTGDKIKDKADQVAGLFGIKESHESKERWARAQRQMEIIKSIPGLKIWGERATVQK